MSLKAIYQITPAYSIQYGGIETTVRNYTKNLRKRGQKVSIITFQDQSLERRKNKTTRVGKNKIYLPMPGNSCKSILNIFSMIRGMRSVNDAILHIHGIRSFLTYLVLIFSKRNNFIVMSPHFHNIKLNFFSKYVSTPILLLFMRRINGYVFASNFERNLFVNNFQRFQDRMNVVIRHGSDNKAISKKYDPIKKQINILMVNRLIAYKRTDVAIKSILPDNPSLNLTIVGDGPQKSYLKSLIHKYNVQKQCRILSNLSSDELHDQYMAADVFLSLSRYEAFGISVQDAFQFGLPAVVSRGTALDEFAQKGWCVSFDIAEINNIHTIIVDVLCSNRLGQYPMLSWDQTITKLMEFYNFLYDGQNEQGVLNAK